MFVGEFDDDVVLSGCGGHVGDGAGAVLVVLAGDLGLGGALDGESEAARARVLRVDGEESGLATHTMAQARAVRRHIAAVHGFNMELEGTACNDKIRTKFSILHKYQRIRKRYGYFFNFFSAIFQQEA